MKKLLILVMLSSVFGTAHATRSRMNSLGQDRNQGSFYFGDNRNFFRNPANVAKMRNFMVAELKSGDELTNLQNNFEGGYFGEFNSDIAYGVYLGKQAVQNAAVAAAVGSSATFLTSADANPLNFFLAGGSDMKWGLNLNYAGTKEEAVNGEFKYNGVAASVGIETSNGLQAYLSYNISDKSEGAVATPNTPQYGWELDSTGWQVGLIYGLSNDYTIFGQYSGGKTDIKMDWTGEVKTSAVILGIGKIYELNPTSRFNFDLSWQMAKSEDGPDEITKNTLPLVIGLEADATEWLILRGSVRQNFILGEYEVKTGSTTTSDSTTDAIGSTEVAIGATLHFGKLKLDGNLGGFGTDTNSNLLNSSEFFVNAAVTYMY